MSTSAISSNLLSQIADSPSEANQFVTDLNHLAQDVQGGNLSAANDDFVTLSEDALNGAASSTATTSASGITTSLLSNIASSSDSSSSFVNELNQLGTDLQNGNLSAAQQDLLALDSTALNATSSPANSSGTASTTASAAPPGQAAQLIHAIVEALQVGDSSVVSSALSELASVSPSSAGASILQQESESFGAGSGSTSASSSVNQLLQSLNTNGSGSNTSELSLLA